MVSIVNPADWRQATLAQIDAGLSLPELAAWLSELADSCEPAKLPRGESAESQGAMLAYLAAEHVRDTGSPDSVADYARKALPLIGARRFAAAFASYARKQFKLGEQLIGQALGVVSSTVIP